MPAAGVDKNNANPLIFFSLSKTQNYVPAVFLSVNDNQKLSKLLIKVFERSVYWNEYKTKSENKMQQMNKGISSNHTFLELINYLS